MRFVNWLLFGYCSPLELEEKTLPSNFNETFLVIKKDGLFVFSSNTTKDYFYQLFSKINDIKIEYFFPTKNEEMDSERLQILKISKFVEKTSMLKKVGIPLLYKEKNNILEVEKWPLISAYGLDPLGEGFFTLKHEVLDISLE